VRTLQDGQARPKRLPAPAERNNPIDVLAKAKRPLKRTPGQKQFSVTRQASKAVTHLSLDRNRVLAIWRLFADGSLAFACARAAGNA
jgi:hypothetical protein